mgnify:CR=1 FL=1
MTTEADVRVYLMTAGVSGFSSNNIFVGPPRKATGLSSASLSARSMFIMETGGAGEPHEFLDGSSNTYRTAEVQIRIRGLVNDYLNTRVAAEAVWVKMQKVSTSSMGSTTSQAYCRIVNITSAPMYLGVDDLERDEFVVNTRLEHGG